MNEDYDLQHYIDEVKKEVNDHEIIGDLLAEEPKQSQYEECCIMVFNIPVINSDRLPKLQNVLSGIFSIQNTYKYNDHYPVDSEGKTKGYCFLEYQTKEAANAAQAVCDGYRLDKNHCFSSYPFTALRDLKEPTKNWKIPEKRPYVDLGDRWWWLQNPKSTDQFAIQYETENGLQLDVYTHARTGDPTPVEDAQRINWSEDLFKWSPHGSYLATLHNRGIALWGGRKFEKFQRFEHEGVNYIEFSTNEKYLVTYACGQSNVRDNENCLRIFDVFTGEMKKAFSPSGKSASNRVHEWPFVKWSHDEKYFAFCRLRGNCINVFNTADFMLCDNKAIELDGLLQFEFNPVKNLIAYFSEERNNANAPAEIGILEIPSREKIRTQRIFSVFRSNLFWQKAGSYLAVHTERYQKMVKGKDGEIKYTGVSSHLEIFDCTEKVISVLTIQLPEPFASFSWEPKGNKFCVLIGTSTRITPLVYRYDKGKSNPILLGKLEAGNNLNSIAWAPQGGFLTVFGANTPNGIVYFVDASAAETATRIRSIEHAQLSQAFWDPTGRYFVTCTFGGKSRYETGYRIHTFLGRELIRKTIDSMVRFKWRPRPPVQLPEQKVKEIKKSLKQQSQKFEEEDKRELLKVSKEIIEFRRNALAQFEKIFKRAKETEQHEQEIRIKLRGGIDPKLASKDLVEETITITLSTEMEDMRENYPKEDTTTD